MNIHVQIELPNIKTKWLLVTSESNNIEEP